VLSFFLHMCSVCAQLANGKQRSEAREWNAGSPAVN
jgi:hypothetical protein